MIFNFKSEQNFSSVDEANASTAHPNHVPTRLAHACSATPCRPIKPVPAQPAPAHPCARSVRPSPTRGDTPASQSQPESPCQSTQPNQP